MLSTAADLNRNPIVSLDADRFPIAKPREEFSVVDDLLSEGGLGHAGVTAIALDALDDGLVRNHTRKDDGQ